VIVPIAHSEGNEIWYSSELHKFYANELTLGEVRDEIQVCVESAS
jgi:hypothetical protein